MPADRKTIACIAADCLRRDGLTALAWGDVGILDAIGEEAGLTALGLHPLDRHRRILNALDANTKTRNPLFVKLQVRAHSGIYDARRIVRGFKLHGTDQPVSTRPEGIEGHRHG